MAGRFVGGALLTAGLVVITLAGAASGYGIGHLTEPKDQPATSASPLGPSSGTPKPAPTPTPTEPLNVAEPDPTPALKRSKLRYKEREFVAEKVVRSQVTVEVPTNWQLTLSADPPNEAKFSDPTGRRFVRVQAGFTIERPPAASMEERIGQLTGTPYRNGLKIVDQDVADDGRSATLTYTHVPTQEHDYIPQAQRYVVVRWIALDESGNCAVEIGAVGLNQDKDALWAVLERASETVTRSDHSL